MKLMAKLREAEMAVEAEAGHHDQRRPSGEHATFERLLTEQRLACDEEIKRILKANQEEKALPPEMASPVPLHFRRQRRFVTYSRSSSHATRRRTLPTSFS